MESSSPWARQGSPAATLPGPRAQSMPPTPAQTLPPPQAAPQWPALGQPVPPHAPPRRPVSFGKISLTLLSAAVAAAVGSGTTLLWVAHEKQTAPTAPATSAPQSAMPTPQFSPKQINDAKTHLCQTFDVSVRGQQGQGGLRGEGNLNVPVTLRAVNSALAVQVALVPAVPADVAKAARNYAVTTLDATTAAMGNSPTSDVNRLTDVRNDALQDLIGVCGLPR
jgi:hypothetical protein